MLPGIAPEVPIVVRPSGLLACNDETHQSLVSNTAVILSITAPVAQRLEQRIYIP